MKNRCLIVFLMLVAAVSCVRDLTLDPGEEPIVVVDCVLCDESPQTLRLFYSQPPTNSKMTPITEAEVGLIDKTEGKTVGMFVNKEGKEWTLDYTAVPEHEYRLDIRVPGHNLVYAEDTMPAVPDVETKFWDMGLNGSSYSPVVINEDSEFGAGFYGMAYRLLSPIQTVWIYSMYYDSETGNHRIAEEICTDNPSVDNFNLTGSSYTPMLFMHSLGVFSSYVFESELYPQLNGEAVHRRFLRLNAPGSEEGSAKEWFLISGNFEGSFMSSSQTEPLGNQGFLVCSAFSETYDSYIRDAIRFQNMQDSSSQEVVYTRENLVSNVVGGIGIFGAQVKIKLPWIRGWDYETIPKITP